MHLEGDVTVVSNLTVGTDLSQLDINYVTSIDPEDENCQEGCEMERVQFCKSVKFEPVIVKEEYHRLQDRLAPECSTQPNQTEVNTSVSLYHSLNTNNELSPIRKPKTGFSRTQIATAKLKSRALARKTL